MIRMLSVLDVNSGCCDGTGKTLFVDCDCCDGASKIFFVDFGCCDGTSEIFFVDCGSTFNIDVVPANDVDIIPK